MLFAGDDELIEIKHTALSKQVFVAGAMKAAAFALQAPKGFYAMGDALFPGKTTERTDKGERNL